MSNSTDPGALHEKEGARGGRQRSQKPETAAVDTAGALFRQVPPHSIEAEQALLGGVFLKPDAIYGLVSMLKEEDFYLPAHSSIYAAFVALFRKSVPIDLITVSEYLRAVSQLETVGGAAYLAELAQSAISAANTEYYAGIVRDKSLVRSLIGSCTKIIGSCFDPVKEVQELLDESEQAVFAVTERTTGKTFKNSSELTESVFSELEARINRKESISGVRTWYTKLDGMTAGFQPSDLIIIAARPSMGKTAFALNLAMRAAVRGNVPVAIFSLEMSSESLMMRMLCAWGKVDLFKLRKNFLDDADWQGLHDAAAALTEAPIYIDDTPAISPLDLRARTRRLKMEKGVGLVVVDYLQLMSSSKKRVESREREISEISSNLKAMAKELQIPVIALSQLNRKLEERTRKERRPLLSDLRESGAIEQDADLILFIYREAAYLQAAERPPVDKAEIIIGKHRNGPVGTVELTYIPAYTSFEDMAVYDPGVE